MVRCAVWFVSEQRKAEEGDKAGRRATGAVGYIKREEHVLGRLALPNAVLLAHRHS